MPLLMPELMEETPLFYYVIEIDAKELPLVIMRNGMSHWDDHTERRKNRQLRQQHLELRAFTGDHDAFRELQNEISEYTVSIEVPERIRLKVMEMVQKERTNIPLAGKPHAMTRETVQDVVEMDELLRDFFWSKVNPLLSQPIESSKNLYL